jgi:hypothetical protein
MISIWLGRRESDPALHALPQYNRRFAEAAADSTVAWGRVRSGVDLTRVCSFYYEGAVQNDNTVRLGSWVRIDIPPGPRNRSYARARVELRQLLDGSWRVYRRDSLIATAAATGHGELRSLKSRRRWAGCAAGDLPMRTSRRTDSPSS